MKPHRASLSSTAILQVGWPLLLAAVAFTYLARHFEMTQDDAFITYRYVANYLSGHGLVFNWGERVEGFTNFGWTIYLLAAGVLRTDFILVSKVTGFLCGLGTVGITYLVGLHVLGPERRWYAVGALWLVGVNQALAYWSPAGLETAAFSLATMAALYWYLTRSHLLIFGLVLAVALRPEGAMVAAILIATEWLDKRRLPGFTLRCALAALAWSMPMVAFKYLYYGSILPNPFYAKTSFDLQQLGNGLEYSGLFLREYGFYGVGLLVPLLFWKRLGPGARSVLCFTIAFMLYVTLIGGDVLKVHRFFTPIEGLSAVLLMLTLKLIVDLRSSFRLGRLAPLVVVVMLALTVWLPRDTTAHYSRNERGLVTKMAFMAERIREADSTNFSVAVSTIGRFSYERSKERRVGKECRSRWSPYH